MYTLIKKILYITTCSFLILIVCILPLNNFTEATPPKYDTEFTSDLTSNGWLISPKNYGVSKDRTLRQNIVALFYPSDPSITGDYANAIYKVIRDMTL